MQINLPILFLIFARLLLILQIDCQNASIFHLEQMLSILRHKDTLLSIKTPVKGPVILFAYGLFKATTKHLG